MIQRHLLLLAVLGCIVVLAAGCGRPVLPGQQFRGKPAVTSTTPTSKSPLPAKPIVEAGPANAKVRVVAFFPIDDQHKPVMDLLKGLVKEYPGKVYMKYVDPRTPQGYEAFQNAKMTVSGLMINSEQEYTIHAKPNPYTVDFSQEMGRYWTADDLKKAVAGEVEKQYGKGSAGK
jgi:hypothetical protein